MSLPFQKPKNKSRRSREYLTEAEVNKIITAARNIGRHGDKEKKSFKILPPELSIQLRL